MGKLSYRKITKPNKTLACLNFNRATGYYRLLKPATFFYRGQGVRAHVSSARIVYIPGTTSEQCEAANSLASILTDAVTETVRRVGQNRLFTLPNWGSRYDEILEEELDEKIGFENGEASCPLSAGELPFANIVLYETTFFGPATNCCEPE